MKKEQMDPELKRTALFIKFFLPTFKTPTLQLANAALGLLKGKCRSKLYYEERYIKRPDGTLLRLAIYAPIIRKPNSVGLLYIHGGGYGLGVPELNEKFYKKLIDKTDCVIIAPDYTLSVEKPYPAAIEDCYLALKWMKEYGSEYMINKNQLMVAGESAGGGLTAALTLLARDKKEINIAFQMPLYPMIDDRMQTESSQNNNVDPVWNSESNYLGWKMYLGDYFQKDDVPIYASAARAKDYKGIPPTLTYVGTVEPFKDETIIYVERLRQDGVKVDFKIFEGGYHAFDMIKSNSALAKQAHEFLLENFHYATKNYFADNKE